MNAFILIYITLIYLISGGTNVDYINKFLANYGVILGKTSISSDFNYSNNNMKIRSGSSIINFPQGGYLFGVSAKNDEYLINKKYKQSFTKAVIGLLNKVSFIIYSFINKNKLRGKETSGRLALITDNYCIDDYQLMHNTNNNCFDLISKIIL